MFDVKGKVALITGGLGGIGLAFAREFLKNGLEGVALVDIFDDDVEVVLKQLSGEFGPNRALFLKKDVTTPEDVESAFRKTIQTYHNLDIVINCAGIAHQKDWEKVVAVNFIAPYRITLLAMESFLPKYKSGAEGLIVNVASIWGVEKCPSVPSYVATKTALVSVGRNFGDPFYYNQYQVKVMTLCPGLTKTNLTKGDRFEGYYSQPPEDLAKMLTIILQKGENGSVWVCENSEPPYEFKYTSRQEFHPSANHN